VDPLEHLYSANLHPAAAGAGGASSSGGQTSLFDGFKIGRRVLFFSVSRWIENPIAITTLISFVK